MNIKPFPVPVFVMFALHVFGGGPQAEEATWTGVLADAIEPEWPLPRAADHQESPSPANGDGEGRRRDEQEHGGDDGVHGEELRSFRVSGIPR